MSERVIDVEWGVAEDGRRRPCMRWTWLWRRPTVRACCAISPGCSPREKMNVIGVQTQSMKDNGRHGVDDVHR